MTSLVAWVIHLDMKEPVATFLEKVRGKTTYWSIKKERNKKKHVILSPHRGGMGTKVQELPLVDLSIHEIFLFPFSPFLSFLYFFSF